jgi:hypothetical protein
MGMTYSVAIRKNETGEVRICEMEVPWGETSLFWWTEGNFGCDCNRELLFERASEQEMTTTSSRWSAATDDSRPSTPNWKTVPASRWTRMAAAFDPK